MIEIRICHKNIDKDQEPIGTGAWHPDSPGNREMLQIILALCNEIHGPGTHMIEVRNGTSLSQKETIY